MVYVNFRLIVTIGFDGKHLTAIDVVTCALLFADLILYPNANSL